MVGGKQQQHIVVLGAGVIGLQTAVTLLEAGCDVTVVAELWTDTAPQSQEWTSPWAGAQWRAHAVGGSAPARWEAVTYRAWARIHAAEAAAGYANGQGPSSLASILMDNLYSGSMVPGAAARPPWWSALDARSFAELSAAELPVGVAYGARMRAFTLDPARHLAWLQRRIDALGGRRVRARLPSSTLQGVVEAARQAVHDAHPSAPSPNAFVNALGLGVAALGIDRAVVPNRGQTLLVRGETSSMRTRLGPSAGDVIAVIPRPGTGTTIVGSTRGPGRSDAQEDVAETQLLLRGGKEVAPDLFERSAVEPQRGQLIEARVGFRPRRCDRDGKVLGARVEREILASGVLVVHAYGHEGAGFQQAIGTAGEVGALLGVDVKEEGEDGGKMGDVKARL